MLISKEQAVLLVVDVQEKLLPAIHEHQTLLARIDWLIRACHERTLPIGFSEQYPQGLGPTLPALLQRVSEPLVFAKQHFSCLAAHAIPEQLLEKQQFILCGIESHVCVLQTAIELAQVGKQVFVVADCVGSRNPQDHALALERLRAADISIVSREMVLFELLQKSGTPEFKAASKAYLQGTQP